MGKVVEGLKKQFAELKSKTLNDLLAQCTEPQRELFGRIYPNGVPDESMESAIDLCERTIAKNQKGRLSQTTAS